MLKNPTTIGEPSEIGKRDAIIEIRHKVFLGVMHQPHLLSVLLPLCHDFSFLLGRSHYARMQNSSPVANPC